MDLTFGCRSSHQFSTKFIRIFWGDYFQSLSDLVALLLRLLTYSFHIMERAFYISLSSFSCPVLACNFFKPVPGSAFDPSKT